MVTLNGMQGGTGETEEEDAGSCHCIDQLYIAVAKYLRQATFKEKKFI